MCNTTSPSAKSSINIIYNSIGNGFEPFSSSFNSSYSYLDNSYNCCNSLLKIVKKV
nr:MAG TPA: hypothetical protein [Bacteriophage sp.]